MEVTFVADIATAKFSEFVVDTNNQLANDSDMNIVIATLTDEQENPISDQQVMFTVTNGTATLSATTVTTDADGKAEVSVKSSLSGDKSIKASFTHDSTTVTETVDVNFKVYAKLHSFQVTTNNVAANGIATNKAVAVIYDADDKPLPNYTVTFKHTGNFMPADQYTGSVQTNSNGEAVLEARSYYKQLVTFSTTVDGTKKEVGLNYALADIVAGGMTFSSEGKFDTYSGAEAYCQNRSKRLPSVSEIANLYGNNSVRNFHWESSDYWTSDSQGSGTHTVASLDFIIVNQAIGSVYPASQKTTEVTNDSKQFIACVD